jgi:predicted Zn-dependent protease with MMP-like domain
MAHHVSREEFLKLVDEAITGIPESFRQHLENVRVEVRDRPTKKELKELGLDADELLMGLYVGQALTDRSIFDGGAMPDVIYIFQEDCELSCDSREELLREVRVTVLHEIGHHFGLDEDDLDDLGYG